MRTPCAYGSILALWALGSLGLAQERLHVVALPDHAKWEPAPPKLPPGAQFAKLVGDPSKPGEPYVFRAKLPDGYSVPPHWHPMDENVTVINGVFRVGFGTRIDSAKMRDLPAGSYAMLPKEVPHYNIMKGETILQFHGIGPYDITYVDAADDPRRKSTGKQSMVRAPVSGSPNPADLRLELFQARLDPRRIVTPPPRPAFALIVATTLALGIGANTAMFSPRPAQSASH